jgi:signal transduction histidine kinase
MEKSVQEGLIERSFWLIRLRWIAVIGVIFTVLFVSRIIKLFLPTFALYTIALILGLYNLIFFILLGRIRKKESQDIFFTANHIANLQISFDLTSLAFLIHFSGGIENPFIFYFIFHMIIASILLSRRASFLQATYAVLLFSSLVTLEYFGILPHYCLKGFIMYNQHNNPFYIVGVSFVFITTLYIAVYMATSISNKLRDREKNLKQANALLSEKDRIKSEYVLRLTHDIKEHLSAIQSCLEPVAGGITGELNLKQRNLIQRANERAEKLAFFIRALLEITRLRLSKQIDMTYFSLKETVENAISFVDQSAKDKGIFISCNIEPRIGMIKGAEIYIEETIANLLANSVKYTPRNGKINLKVSDRGNSVLIEIADTGIGVPKDELPKIFEEFYRASNAKEVEKYGTGLGLSIAKQVVERHAGKIWAESQEGEGSAFYIILPKEQEKDAPQKVAA